MSELKNRISTKALKVWRISGVIKAAVGWSITAVVVFLVKIFDGPFWISAILIVLGIVFTGLHIFVFPVLRWKHWRYEVREEELETQEGYFVKTRTLVPMVRIQHVDMVQGPLLSRYKLASVVIYTAATVHEIPALEEDEAEELRFYLSKLARVAEDDV